MLSVFKKSKTLVGVDIGSSSIKIVELGRVNDVYHVQSYAMVSLKEDAVLEQEIKNVELLTNAISQAITIARVKTKATALAMPSSLVITKIVQMDAELKESDMEVQIQLDANRYIPYPLEEVSFDFDILGPNAKDEKKVNVLIAASRTEHVDVRVDAVADAGLIPQVMDVESYAIERVLPLLALQLPNRGINKVVAVMNIGGNVSSLTVLENLNIIYTREEAFGGKQLTDIIRSRFGLNYEQAEKLKREGGLSQEGASEILQTFKETIATQVANSLQFFYSAGNYNAIDCIVLAGGAVETPGLCDVIQERNQMPTFIANPFAGMTVASHINKQQLEKDAPALLIACGLALRSFDT